MNKKLDTISRILTWSALPLGLAAIVLLIFKSHTHIPMILGVSAWCSVWFGGIVRSFIKT